LVGTSALAALLLTAAVLEPSGSTTGSKGSDTVAFSALPAEARRAHALIRTGGPFPYSKDGTVFGNRERLLPSRQRGDYREYTVPTPQSRDRGAKRIVCAGAVPTAPEACYYTDDHYASFRLIAQ
jgi:ribonuclease T1